MKRILLIIPLIVFFCSALNAQKDSAFYRHEVKMSVSDALLYNFFWSPFDKSSLYVNVSFSYLYRAKKWFWVGGNFINYFGDILNYSWKEYYPNGTYRYFSKSKLKYYAALAPEIRFSYLNRKKVILYSGFSVGICFEDGYDSKKHKYPKIHPFFHTTYIGVSANLGKNNNIFLGGELGGGFKGFLNLHGGYRF